MKRFFALLLAVCSIATAAAQSTFTSTLAAKAKKGATIYGTVECDGKPLAGVQVSDGYEITTTDKRGVYNLASAKRNGYVFITLPSGYEAPTEGNDVVPQFWANLTADAQTAERHDFALRKVDNLRHVVVAITDIHIANHLDDIGQFKRNVMPRINEEVEKYRSQGIPVYTICMGDSSFDSFWYDFLFDIRDFRSLLADVKYPTPFFHSMGNHDNNGAHPEGPDTDFLATDRVREAFGPTYYSFNIGGIHYVMLDNIFYINKATTAKTGTNIAGSRSNAILVSPEQLEWLKKDLAAVTDKSTPIVIGMHSPIYKYKKNHIAGEVITRFTDMSRKHSLEEAYKLSELLKDFSDVHFLTGHTHRTLTVHGKYDTEKPLLHNTIDHNISSICGAWWHTGAHGGLHLAPDSAPAGFEVFTANNKSLEWYYTSIDDGADKQFRTFDMNSVRDYYRSNGEVRVFLSHYPERANFADIKDNRVAIHVWAWEPTWKVTVKENGVELPVTHRPMENPQYAISYHIPKSIWRRELDLKRYNKADKTPHMFHVTASSPTSTLEITVTDGFGRTYTETMTRPKQFHKLMR